MAEEEKKKIIVDDDWKQEAKREKEKLAEEATGQQSLPEPSFAELVNIIMVQALAALGMLPGPKGERMQPQPDVAKHFIDLLQLLEEKTKGNLTDEEKQLLDQVLYESRMAFVQASGGSPGGPGGPGGPGVGPAPAQ